jgi:hypothetical protein
MGLVEDVDAAMPTINYRARECIDSRRNQLLYYSKMYCMLSDPGTDIHCPLQAEKRDGANLAECLRNDYFRELKERRREKG